MNKAKHSTREKFHTWKHCNSRSELFWVAQKHQTESPGWLAELEVGHKLLNLFQNLSWTKQFFFIEKKNLDSFLETKALA